MEEIRLHEVCLFNPALPIDIRKSTDQVVSFVPMSSLKVSGHLENIGVRPLKEVLKGYRYFREGDVLFAKITPCMENGKAGLVVKLPFPIGFGSTEFHVMRPQSQLFAGYLAHFVRQEKFRYIAKKKMKGAAGQKRVPLSFLKNLNILLPTFKTQIQIATLLSRVEALITTRKENQRLLDEFLKSAFLEMFGDPVENEKGWDIDDCHKVVVEIKSGTSYGGEDRSILKDHEMGVLKISAVTQGIFNAYEFKAVHHDKIKKHVITVKKGDFLVSRANTFELVAACCVVDKSYDRLFLPDKLWRLRFDEERINPQFFNYLLKNNSFRNIVRKQASGGHESMLNISMAKFRQLRVIVPDKPSQDKFANIVDKIGSLQKRYQDNLTELENLYGVLSQKAFKGELDLSNIPTEKKDPGEITEETGGSVCTPVEIPDIKFPQINPIQTIDSDYGRLQQEYGLPPIDSMGGKAEEKDIDLTDSSIRKRYVDSLLNIYLSNQKGKYFSMDEFSSLIEEKFEQLSSEDDQILIEAGDYDTIRNSLFHLLDNGQLVQNFNETSNKVELNIKQ